MLLNVFQQVVTLSLTSNLINDSQGTQTDLQQALQKYLASSLPLFGWQVVWGPVVWKHQDPDNPDTGPDNSWYIAYHPALEFEDGSVHPTYVIAIAGTPSKSEYVWTEQNFAVNRVVDFHAWVASGVCTPPEAVEPRDVVQGTSYIAFGTVNAVHLLLTAPSPEGAASPGMMLFDFVANYLPDGARLITTGHSLGGALSPSLALSLVTSKAISPGRVLTYPTAGASPGNSAFTELFAEVFPSTPGREPGDYRVWNCNLVNTLDIVPQAWAVTKATSPEQNIGNIPTIYGTPSLKEVVGVSVLLGIQALKSGARYLPLPSQFFTGTPPSEVPENLTEFLDIAVQEHIKAYFDLFGFRLTQPLSGRGITEKPKAEKRYNYPIIATFEWALEHPKETEEEVTKVEGSEQAEQVLNQN